MLLDGHDIRSLDLSWYRSHVGLVAQVGRYLHLAYFHFMKVVTQCFLESRNQSHCSYEEAEVAGLQGEFTSRQFSTQIEVVYLTQTSFLSMLAGADIVCL